MKKILFNVKFNQGYGKEPHWIIEAIVDNKVIDTLEADKLSNVGRDICYLQQKWNDLQFGFGTNAWDTVLNQAKDFV